MAELEKAAFKVNTMDCMVKSRNSKTPEELQFDRIVNKQTKRRSRKKADGDDEKDLLEWVGFFKQNEDSKTILKRRSVEMFYRCEEFERKAVMLIVLFVQLC